MTLGTSVQYVYCYWVFCFLELVGDSSEKYMHVYICVYMCVYAHNYLYTNLAICKDISLILNYLKYN